MKFLIIITKVNITERSFNSVQYLTQYAIETRLDSLENKHNIRLKSLPHLSFRQMGVECSFYFIFEDG
jgi:hypothetical protein